MKNVTPAARPAGTAPAPRRNTLLVSALVIIVLVLLVRACAHHENTYESIAHQFTVAVQANDMAGVQRLENSETAANTTRGRLGRASDVLAPLGAVKSVKEVTPSGDRPRVHEFDVTFAKGTVHEQLTLDPDNKIFGFHYDPPQTAS